VGFWLSESLRGVHACSKWQTSGFPLHAGGTLRRGAITNSARAIGMTFKVVLELSEEGGYTVYVPALLGCLSKGDTVEEALQNIREAIQLYLEPVEEPEKFLDLL